MKNLALTFIYTFLLLLLCMFFTPWWIILPIGLMAGFVGKSKAWAGFIAGFLAVSILWAGYAVFLNMGNDALLANKVAKIFKLSSGTGLLMITGIVGGLLGGFSVMTGALGAHAFNSTKK